MSSLLPPDRRAEFTAWLERALPVMPTFAGWFCGGFIVTWIAAATLRNVLLGGSLDNFSMLCLLVVSIWGGAETGLHRIGWGGRRVRPRLWIWQTTAIALWLGAVFTLLALGNIEGGRLGAIGRSSGIVPPNTAITLDLVWRIATLTPDAQTIAFRLYLDAIAMMACIGLLILKPRPAGWASFGRFRLFLLASITVVGRPVAGILFERPETGADVGLDPLRVLLAPIVMPATGAVTLVLLAAVIGLVVVLVFFVTVTLPLMIFDLINTRDIQSQVRAQKKAGLEAYIKRFDLWLRHDPLPAIPDDSKGARFSSKEEVETARLEFGFGFGHVGGKPLFLDTDKHVLLMASTRSGKGVSVIIPHLLRYEGSAFVLDPKGENARATGSWRAILNDRVHYLDPFGISGRTRSRFNPLAFFTDENMEASSKALATALVLDGKRDHWTAAGQQLLAAVILHVFTSDSYAPETKDLVTVRRLLLGAIKETLEEMRTNEAAEGLVADLAASFLATPEKEFGSIISTAQRETEILDNPYIAACLAAAGDGDEVDFREWHRGTMTVYLCLSAPKFPTFNRWLRLVLTSALDEMTDQLDPPAQPVCFMLDELATLGHLAAVGNAVGLAAGYGIQLVTVFQDVAQMKDLYKGRWASFIGNAGIRALFSLDDFDTARYWSDFMGGRLVGTLSQSQDIYGITQGQTAGETVRSLLTPEELMLRYASDKMLVLKQGVRPIESDRVPYWRDPALDGKWDDPRPAARPPAPPDDFDFINSGPWRAAVD